jgi:hypothetical protein
MNGPGNLSVDQNRMICRHVFGVHEHPVDRLSVGLWSDCIGEKRSHVRPNAVCAYDYICRKCSTVLNGDETGFSVLFGGLRTYGATQEARHLRERRPCGLEVLGTDG